MIALSALVGAAILSAAFLFYIGLVDRHAGCIVFGLSSMAVGVILIVLLTSSPV